MGLSLRGIRSSRTLNTVGLVAVGLFVLGPVLAKLHLAPAMGGFVLFALGGLLALVVAIIGVVRALRGGGFGRGGMLAATVAALVFLWLAIVQGGSAPLINDYTTDPVDPPAFKQDAGLPANVGRDMGYPQAFAEVQRGCCADLAPQRLALDPAAAFAVVENVATAMPHWTVTRRDPQAGELEAVAKSAVFGFEDDIVIRVRPHPTGASIVDMRSKSRNGKGDRGVNAARIRTFQSALAARAAAGPR